MAAVGVVVGETLYEIASMIRRRSVLRRPYHGVHHQLTYQVRGQIPRHPYQAAPRHIRHHNNNNTCAPPLTGSTNVTTLPSKDQTWHLHPRYTGTTSTP